MEIKIKSKLWIESDGMPVFGSGRRLLLEAIERCGSINRAAQEVNMSFRKAWGSLRAMEERLGIKLIERQTGGKGGGGAALTDDARAFMKKFELLEKGLQKQADTRFKAVFKI